MSGAGGEGLAASMADVQEAMERIRSDVHYTPVLQSSHLNSISGLQLFFKCELFQKTGSFKVSKKNGDSEKVFTVFFFPLR